MTAMDKLLWMNRRCLIIPFPTNPLIGNSMEHHAHINSFTPRHFPAMKKLD